MAIVETVEQRPGPSKPVLVTPKTLKTSGGFFDQHHLVPVFIAGIISLALASAIVGSIVLWLSLRRSGIMAP